MTFELDLYRVVLLAGVLVIIGLLIYRMAVTPPAPPRPQAQSDHFSDIGLLGLIAGGLLIYMGFATRAGKEIDMAACLVVLTMIVGAVKERWQSRSLDRMGQSLAAAPALAPEPVPPPADAVEAAHQTADAAVDRAEKIEEAAK